MRNFIKTSLIILIIAISMLVFLNLQVYAANVDAEIDKKKKDHPELRNGYGLESLHDSPTLSFNEKNGRITVHIKCDSGIKEVKIDNSITIKPTSIENNSSIDYCPSVKKGKKEKHTFSITNKYGDISVINFTSTNPDGKKTVIDTSMRADISLNKKTGTFNIILRDHGGINNKNVSMELFSKGKSVTKVSGNNLKLTYSVYEKKRLIFGMYSVKLNKMQKSPDNRYYITIKTTDSVGNTGTLRKSFLSESSSKADVFMKKHEARLAKIDGKFTYHNSSLGWSKKRINCAYPVTLTLRDMGVLKSSDGQVYYSNGKLNNKAKLDKAMKGYSGNGKSGNKLIKEGKLKRGDIVFWKGNHTSVYAGDGKFLDTGKKSTTKPNSERRTLYTK